MRKLGLAPNLSNWEVPKTNDWLSTITERMNVYSGASDPTAAEIPLNQWIGYYNTTTQQFSYWANINGVATKIKADWDDYSTGTFTATGTGFTVAPTASWRYVKHGDLVTVTNDASFGGASNATTFTVTGLPAALWPSTQRNFFFLAYDNFPSAPILALGILDTAGVFNFYTNPATAGWTAANSKYALSFDYTYRI